MFVLFTYPIIIILGVSGPFTASAIAIARCLVQPSFKIHTILRAILRDEIIAVDSKRQEISKNAAAAASGSGSTEGSTEMKAELLISMVTRAVSAILSRLESLAHFDGTESKVGKLIEAATNPDNLCRMDSSWHPWL